ncbi:TIGR03364 family FAD-dependent oxidoreductase [Mesorhizobium sp. M7D.F.Ca.US.005.01.1.1]|uniref:TIGR03364 family FAD-dependent oxidoreductase n=1 Tax=Mesorhizobium sp. M7D.F.Ca.US.005.01.1.1 TaxID=2493678 RepID=UPI000F75CD75|nr:TIGR03364 family FAD-dependent oxidoreductase [Mesorhizobium sp. M7D.F.Ca.US.005.01.1.1]AZO43405.1 TIGR03364 family FAD-dependent oxidoreductase [Mesorhizobium sp. M7D.F.Ca.US.005.01.1.1]
MSRQEKFDLAIVGAGIVGLAHALAAVRRGLSVVVIDRDAQANGASVRNFGFVTVSGQERGQVWRRAMRSRDIWLDVAAPAGIEVIQRGVVVVARRPEARAVVEAFLQTEMGEGCLLLEPEALRSDFPELAGQDFAGGLWSPHDVRVESRQAIPQLAAFLAEKHGVEFRRETAVHQIEPPDIETSRGLVFADKVIVCPGDDLATLYPDRIAQYGVTRCKLQMMRLADPGFRLPAAVMSDLGLARYSGYAALPEATALRRRLEAEQGDALDNGVHLIVVQSADGTLVVGDSHHYAVTPDPFASERVDEIILEEFSAVFGGPPPRVLERWTGIYASATGRTMFADAPREGVRLVMITSGTGASTSFAIAEEVVDELFGSTTADARKIA